MFDLRRPDRRTAMKVLVKKTYHFVEEIWMDYFMRNKNDLRFVQYNQHSHTIITLNLMVCNNIICISMYIILLLSGP